MNRLSRLVRAIPSAFVGSLFGFLVCPTALSQSVLHGFYGEAAGDNFGWSASGAGDVNADGFDDVIVGAPFNDNNGPESGSARVFSGADGSVLYTFNGAAIGYEFGVSVSGAGDVNLDGYDDVIVGSHLASVNGFGSGSAWVFSGVDGSVLYNFHGDTAGDRFGVSVSGAGDVDADGCDDVIVGAWAAANNGPRPGSARVFSGLDGSLLHIFWGDSPDDWFGISVSAAGDVDGDGFGDLIVGASYDDDFGLGCGSARVFSGVDGTVVFTVFGNTAYDLLGDSVSGAGDVNADGFDDVIVGSWGDGDKWDGRARVYSGVDGSVLYAFGGDSAGDRLGVAVSGAGDVNGDGYHDVIVGADGDDRNGFSSGSARVYSGFDGSPLYTLYGDSTYGLFGTSVSDAGDVNGDGRPDVIVGAVLDQPTAIPNDDHGSAVVFAGGALLGTSYCGPAVANSSGMPGVIRAFGLIDASANDTFLTAYQLPYDLFGYFLVSRTQGSFMPPGSQGFICLGGDIGRYDGDVGEGPSFTSQIDLTSMPVNPPQAALPGETWNFQAWYRDVGSTNNFTDAVSVTYQ